MEKAKRLPLATEDEHLEGNTPHNSPEDCPTWYDWCRCTVPTLNSLIDERQRIIEFLEEFDPSYQA